MLENVLRRVLTAMHGVMMVVGDMKIGGGANGGFVEVCGVLFLGQSASSLHKGGVFRRS